MFVFLGSGFSAFWKGVERAEKDCVGYVRQRGSL